MEGVKNDKYCLGVETGLMSGVQTLSGCRDRSKDDTSNRRFFNGLGTEEDGS